MAVVFRSLLQSEVPTLKQLLKESELPYSDIGNDNISFFALFEKEKIVAIGGIECYEKYALLRSVAVPDNVKGKGHGKRMVQKIESEAIRMGIAELFLLTTTGKEFFEKLDYKVISRNQVPDIIKATSEFTSLCPETAICMLKGI
ncbi:MAG: GNAT family N-acetyltransferase [Mariniphaga sp.]|nr:GNAT family N-acetyltransferase [Mariniphaga sp.]